MISNNLKKLTRRIFPFQTAETESLETSLAPAPLESELFLQALQDGQSARGAIVWTGEKSELPTLPRFPWMPLCTERVDPCFRPGGDPRHDAGDYYCLDLSSVFEASVLTQITSPPRLILDLCSSPGGKAILASAMFSPEILICNEVIGKRTAQLVSNLKRCHISSFVTSTDVSTYAEQTAGCFDLVIVDAPCSGQSLVARGKKAPACFHPSTINQNANRQRRIISNAREAVRPGGYLAYMTCTYSPEENEELIAWFLKKSPDWQAIEVEPMSIFKSRLSEVPSYRLYPQYGFGGGGFAALLRRQESDGSTLDDLARQNGTIENLLATLRHQKI